MRIWVGIDVEHTPLYGKQILFVESVNPNIDKVIEILSNHQFNIFGIYFGAGEVDIENWEFLSSLYKISDYTIAVETSKYLNEETITNADLDLIIYRVPIERVSDKVYIKYRAPKEVGVSSLHGFKTTSLYTLNDGKYAGDIELYNDEESV